METWVAGKEGFPVGPAGQRTEQTASLLLWPQVTELQILVLWKGIKATSSVLRPQWHPCEGLFEEESEGTFMRVLLFGQGLGWLGSVSGGQERQPADVLLCCPNPRPQVQVKRENTFKTEAL